MFINRFSNWLGEEGSRGGEGGVLIILIYGGGLAATYAATRSILGLALWSLLMFLTAEWACQDGIRQERKRPEGYDWLLILGKKIGHLLMVFPYVSIASAAIIYSRMLIQGFAEAFSTRSMILFATVMLAIFVGIAILGFWVFLNHKFANKVNEQKVSVEEQLKGDNCVRTRKRRHER